MSDSGTSGVIDASVQAVNNDCKHVKMPHHTIQQATDTEDIISSRRGIHAPVCNVGGDAEERNPQVFNLCVLKHPIDHPVGMDSWIVG